MRKKAIILLLLIPFVIAIFAFVTSTVLIRAVEKDYLAISWDYTANYAFLMAEGAQKLEADPVYETDSSGNAYPIADGNKLVWSSSDSEVASIEERSDGYYLIPESVGTCTITCSNAKADSTTPSLSFTAIIVGDSGAIVINPVRSFSASKISNTDYVGLYDLSYQEVAKGASYDKDFSSLEFTYEIVGNSLLTDEQIQLEHSDNVSVNMGDGLISFNSTGDAYISLKNPFGEDGEGDGTLSFTIVDGVNVYDYDDLLMATNFSEEGESVVLRVNLESLSNTYNLDSDNNILSKKSDSTELFGHYDDETNTFSFEDEIYQFETSYNHDFIDEWNEKVENGEFNSNYHTASTTVNVGVRIRDDFYGNGFTINAHNLAYPSLTQTITDQTTGSSVEYALLADDDLFRGPLYFTSIGVPYNSTTSTVQDATDPIFALYGQDNIGFYVEGDNILLEDVALKNCDFGNNLTNLFYTGTVLEFCGDNITLSDSRVENGRNVIRSYDSMDATIDNCFLNYGYEFLLKVGNNKYNNVDYDKSITYYNGTRDVTTTVSDYIQANTSNLTTDFDYKADSILSFSAIKGTQANEFLGFVNNSPYDYDDYVTAIETVKEAYTNDDGIFNADGSKNYYSSITVNDTFFANSGLSAICMDTMPQGSFIENNITTLINLIFSLYAELLPTGLAATSYPSLLNLTGDNRFYDYKSLADMDYSSLLFQDVGTFIALHGGVGTSIVDITDDDYLPLRAMLQQRTDEFVVEDDQCNLPIFFMGGGVNYSDVVMDETNAANFASDEIVLEPYKYAIDDEFDMEYVSGWSSNSQAKYRTMELAMLRATYNVLGFHEFKYLSVDSDLAPWYGEAIDLTLLTERAS